MAPLHVPHLVQILCQLEAVQAKCVYFADVEESCPALQPSSNETEAEDGKEWENEISEMDGDTWFRCSYCGRLFRTAFMLKEHINQQHRSQT
ncbi:hypothetical protein CC86DRAFT_373863 [Ophiobolus disseminans]|uniref:C2H2-type domain-containing protein n=1 Tax=Ophiobolus disseminans TaxID=1469910 RepID=A0A6A6ZLK7_9PLEO|nr:hypothetical protein CC86DRAFT_373863 [Ophiobolus disseminans]